MMAQTEKSGSRRTGLHGNRLEIFKNHNRESESHYPMKQLNRTKSEKSAPRTNPFVACGTFLRGNRGTQMMTLAIALLFSVGLLGCSSSASTFFETHAGSADTYASTSDQYTQQQGQQEGHTIKPGDQLEITVWGYPEFNTTATVNEFGAITVPLLGEVAAAGMTTTEFTASLKQHLAAYIKGETRVTVAHIQMNQKINVMGSVTKQSSLPVFGEITLVQAITEAGGPAPDADLSHVRIFRTGSGNSFVVVNLTRHLEEGNIQDMPLVRAGDTVFVPQQEDLLKDLSGFGYEVLLLFGFFRLVG